MRSFHFRARLLASVSLHAIGWCLFEQARIEAGAPYVQFKLTPI